MNGFQGNLLDIQPVINVTSDSGPVNGSSTARTRDMMPTQHEELGVDL